MLWPGKHSCFVFGRYTVEISARRSAIMTQTFRGCPQSLKADTRILRLSSYGHFHILSNSLLVNRSAVRHNII